MAKKDIIQIYKKTKDFKKAVLLSGLPVLQAHIKLLSSGVLELHDKIQYSSRSGQLGAKAEELFQKLVPHAVNANRVIKKNNKDYDFLYGNLTINVKYSSLIEHKKTGALNYKLNRVQESHIIVAFLERGQGTELENPIIVVIPNAFIPKDFLNFSIHSQTLKDFTVQKQELAKTIQEYSTFLV
ncbi:MAG: hypothetical protein ACTTH8_05825 [Treponema sp.]